MGSPDYCYQLDNEKKDSIEGTISRSTERCLPFPSSPSRSKSISYL